MPPLTRNALIASSVVLLHAAALWAFQNGLLQRAVEVVVPVRLLEASLDPSPKTEERPHPVAPPPEPAAHPPRHVPVRVHKARPPVPPPTPRPAAIPDRAAPPTAVSGSLDPQPAAPPVASSVATAPAADPSPAAASPGPAPAAVAKVELPVSDADYLHNPAPKWPRLSERLGEHGRVLVRVLIGTDGRPKTAQVKQGSGYARLDEASVQAVMSWRFVPGKRGGVPEEMWVIVPIRWGE